MAQNSLLSLPGSLQAGGTFFLLDIVLTLLYTFYFLYRGHILTVDILITISKFFSHG